MSKTLIFVVILALIIILIWKDKLLINKNKETFETKRHKPKSLGMIPLTTLVNKNLGQYIPTQGRRYIFNQSNILNSLAANLDSARIANYMRGQFNINS